jgi:hypothetical protein
MEVEMAVTRADNVIACTAATDAVTDKLRITKIKWIGDDIADGDVLQITNTATGVLFHHIATADDTGCSEDFSPPLMASGIIVGTMTTNHGTVYVYHE